MSILFYCRNVVITLFLVFELDYFLPNFHNTLHYWTSSAERERELYYKAADFLTFLLTHRSSIKDCEQSEGSIKTTKPQFLQKQDKFETGLETSAEISTNIY